MWNTLTIQPLTLSSRKPQLASAKAVTLLALEHILHGFFFPCALVQVLLPSPSVVSASPF